MTTRRPAAQQVFGPGAAAGGHVGAAELQRQSPEGRKTLAEMYRSFADYHHKEGDDAAAAEYVAKAQALEQSK